MYKKLKFARIYNFTKYNHSFPLYYPSYRLQPKYLRWVINILRFWYEILSGFVIKAF